MKNLLPTTGRRGFLQGAGFLAVSFSIPVNLAFGQEAEDAIELPGDLANNPMLDSWIRINADGTVTLLVGKVELGQGNLTAYSQIAAEELDIERDRLTIISGDTFQGPNQGTTAGS